MYGKKVKLRFIFLALILASVILTVFLVLQSLKENVVYFQSPSEIKSLIELNKKKIRVGGMVKEQSIFIDSDKVNFVITDLKMKLILSIQGQSLIYLLKEKEWLLKVF